MEKRLKEGVSLIGMRKIIAEHITKGLSVSARLTVMR